MIRSRSYIAVPPGATIREQLEDRGMSQKEFAERLGMSEKHVSNLINGKVELTPETAFRLEMVLGIPARFWNNLEAIYREKLIKIKAENALEPEIILAEQFPYDEMAANGWVEPTDKPAERVFNLRKFFEVAELKLLNSDLLPDIAYHRTSTSDPADYSTIVWIQKVKIEARKTDTDKIDLSKLSGSLEEIRLMTLKQPTDFIEELVQKLSACGFALVLIPALNELSLQGAAFYDRKKIVIGLPVQEMNNDTFWFSLFHEIGHVLSDHLNPDSKVNTAEQDEAEVNEFAENIMIPANQFQNFLDGGSFSREAILCFSEEIQIDPGIIAGVLQKKSILKPGQFDSLKTKYFIDKTRV